MNFLAMVTFFAALGCGVEAESRWSSYVAGWTAWNHLRFAGALVASASLVMALVFSAR